VTQFTKLSCDQHHSPITIKIVAKSFSAVAPAFGEQATPPAAPQQAGVLIATMQANTDTPLSAWHSLASSPPADTRTSAIAIGKPQADEIAQPLASLGPASSDKAPSWSATDPQQDEMPPITVPTAINSGAAMRTCLASVT